MYVLPENRKIYTKKASSVWGGGAFFHFINQEFQIDIVLQITLTHDNSEVTDLVMADGNKSRIKEQDQVNR